MMIPSIWIFIDLLSFRLWISFKWNGALCMLSLWFIEISLYWFKKYSEFFFLIFLWDRELYSYDNEVDETPTVSE